MLLHDTVQAVDEVHVEHPNWHSTQAERESFMYDPGGQDELSGIHWNRRGVNK